MIRNVFASACALAIVAGACVACGHVGPSPQQQAVERELGKRFILERASFDMKCDQSKIDVAYLGDAPSTKFGTRGCDQQCTYTVHCNTGGTCEVLDGACEKSSATTSTAPPTTTPDSTAPKKETP